MSAPSILIAWDENPSSARVLAGAFSKAGFSFRLVPTPRGILAKGQEPLDAILLNGEPESPAVQQLLQALVQSSTLARVPIFILCQDPSARKEMNALRRGVVELLGKPFDPNRHPQHVQQLLRELPERSGIVAGNGPDRMVGHIKTFARSGALSVRVGQELFAKAVFAGGVLQTADHGRLHGAEALAAMVDLPRAAWVFTELQGSVGEGAGVFVDGADGEEEILDGEPLIPDPPGTHALFSENAIRLLLVDDDPELCRMFRILFSNNGYAVSVASDGEAGYERAVAENFGVIVADLNMPKLDGWGLLRKLRDDFRTREVPFAMLSCQDDYREALRAVDAGAQAYFSKTARLETLIQKVRALVTPRQKFTTEVTGPKLGRIALGALGPLWVTRELASVGLTGRLASNDHWAAYELYFQQGRLVHVTARAGPHHAEGERAFLGFIASRAEEAVWSGGVSAPRTSLHLPNDDLFTRAVAGLNDNAHKVRESLLMDPGSIEVDAELYRVYRQNGPKRWLPTAKLLCEEGRTPREILATVPESPLDVEETLRDLMRRGVVTFRASKG